MPKSKRTSRKNSKTVSPPTAKQAKKSKSKQSPKRGILYLGAGNKMGTAPYEDW